ncbi:protein phosphatase 2C domain-containing protein [Microtetraspora sp. AC03309]|uniref:protein phosphatase 2C domain-containing protein n=1 Tax=Microtetraspora sp. AC03309 TaxID=2779376 RepID=UPI001E293251|nr:protein phosphatase 2C domain-containing protein [Microtetraspora sp. AC03309]MCC5576438.1 protein phosphatase 2C domain-containing protein [Microtetraspora sp. AC03309]
MRVVTFATEPASPDRPNEDFIAATPDAVVLLDGAGTPAGSESGCTHGVAWYARTLGSTLIASLTQSAGPLTGILAEGIKATTSLHDFTCDVNHPGSPSATVVILRRTGDDLDYLVLADSVLVLDVIGTEDPITITDDREGQVGKRYRTTMDALDSGTPDHAAALRAYVEAMRAHRNHNGGFWVASSDPLAAEQALTGTLPADQIRAAALLSDGASRLVDRFGLATWRQALDILDQDGPAELIRQVREAERSDVTGWRWPRGKTFDDATAFHALL